MLRGPGRFLLAPAHLQGVCWAWGPVGSASVPPDLDSRLLEASTPDFCPEQDVGKRTRGPRGGLTLSLQPTVNQPPSPGVPVWGAPRSSSLWSPTPVPLLRFCLSRPGEPCVAGAPNSGLPGSTLGGGPRTVSGKCHDPLPRTRAPSPDPLLRGVRKRSGLGHGPCAVTVPFPGQASNTPKWAPFFSGKSPRRWTEGTGLSRLLLRPRPGALCSGCGATGRRACSRALAVLLHQGLPQGTAGCLGARPCGPPVTAALSGPSCCSQGLRKHRPFLSYLLRPEGLQCCPPALLWARRWPATA